MTSPLLDYPPLFAEKLRANTMMRAAVDSSLGIVADVLQVSKLPFFPDYTDHGIQHLTALLGIAEKLIAARSRDVFTPEDTAVLILSVLLHDLALHLSEAGFKSLLHSQKDLGASKSNDWEGAWLEFLSVARHWDDRKLAELFGADDFGVPRALVRDPFDHYDNLTESDRKLIGEFIRQHHAQLAYQFGVLGFPGKDGRLVQFGSFVPELQELAGIVARSHGFPLRDSVQLLKEKQFNILEQENVHPVFLMGILRVADFLELGRDRAPLVAFAYKEFKSPVSEREWRSNQAFRRISWGNPDPESIHIPAKPTDVCSFLELKRWLAAIQSELDTTWAVLGEVYGAHPKFSRFGLEIRRVRSNILDDSQEFAKSATFVPKHVELGVAGADILKLFIEPLYGEHPEIGIRELMQNAVDAVRERWEYEKNHPGCSSPGFEVGEGDVAIWLDDPDEKGVALLTVRDNGIGMTDDIIINYFLKAGASFRRSISWKKEFESEAGSDHKTQIKSRVLRSGRFGIGVLAAFLLGDEIEVSTRHITDKRGIQFSMRLDLRPPALELSPIQLNYDANLPVGTTIKIKVNKVKRAIVEKKGRSTMTIGTDIFSDPYLWDWYCLETPSIVRVQGRQKRLLTQDVTVPAEEGPLPPTWHLLPSSGYRTVHVRTRGATPLYIPGLVCNGIKVKQIISGVFQSDQPLFDWTRDRLPKQGVFRLRHPDFSIFDPDGNLPLNLQRTGLANLQLDFLDEAFLAQAKAVFAYFLLSAPAKLELTDEFLQALRNLFEFDQIFPVFFTNTGMALLTTTNLRIATVKNILLVNLEAFEQDWLGHIRERYDAMIVARWGQHDTSPIYCLNQLNHWLASARVITKSYAKPVVGKPLRFRYNEFSIDGFHIYRTANCSASLFKQVEIQMLGERFRAQGKGKAFKSANDFIAAELFLKQEALSEAQPTVSLGYYWEKIIRDPVIPFDLTERQTKLTHAYAALSEYLADYPGSDRP